MNYFDSNRAGSAGKFPCGLVRGVRRSWRAGFALGALFQLLAPGAAGGLGFEGVTRDAFPVFDHPQMVSVEQAESQRMIFPRDMVIGVSHGKAAKAYPITVMGYHELGNDTIDGIPIAVSW